MEHKISADGPPSSAVWETKQIMEEVIDPQVWKLQTMNEILLNARLEDGLENTDGLITILGEVISAYGNAKRKIDSLFDNYRKQEVTS